MLALYPDAVPHYLKGICEFLAARSKDLFFYRERIVSPSADLVADSTADGNGLIPDLDENVLLKYFRRYLGFGG